MAEKNWAKVQERGSASRGTTSRGTTGERGSVAANQTYSASSQFDPTAFFDSVDTESSNLSAMSNSLRNTLAHAQQAAAQAQARASVSLGVGGSGTAEEDENTA